MKWTTNKPTSDGWYWCKCRGILTGNIFDSVVKVYDDCKTVFWDGENFEINNEHFLQWSDIAIEKPVQESQISRIEKLIDKVFREWKNPHHTEWCGDGAACCTCKMELHEKTMNEYYKELQQLIKDSQN